LHEEILRDELPLFRVLKDDPPPRDQAFPPPLSKGEKLDVTALLEVGQESPTRLATRNLARVPQVARLLELGTYTVAGSVAERVGRRVGRFFRR
jgi:hypothetical protein